MRMSRVKVDHDSEGLFSRANSSETADLNVALLAGEAPSGKQDYRYPAYFPTVDTGSYIHIISHPSLGHRESSQCSQQPEGFDVRGQTL